MADLSDPVCHFSVDTETEQRIQQGLANVLQGRIAFVIAHRLSIICNVERIIVIRDEVIDELGTHEELMSRRGSYFDMYCQQNLSVPTWVADPLAVSPGLYVDEEQGSSGTMIHSEP